MILVNVYPQFINSWMKKWRCKYMQIKSPSYGLCALEQIIS